MKKFVLLTLLVLCCNIFFALVPPLEREVNLSLSNEKFSDVLIKIQDQTGLIFSYKPSVVSNIEPISLQIKHKTVREALALMLPKSIIYKTKSNYIILKEKPVEQNPKKTEISGYVYDKTTEQKIANVTIYDKESLQSVTTDQYGFYSISVPTTNEKISINKENYKDTSITLAEVKDNKINNITIDPVSEVERRRDSVYWKNKIKDIGLYSSNAFRKFRGYVNTINIKDTIHRNFQVSLFPFIGTNHKLSGNVVNKISLNVYGGFAKGVDGFEAGGLFNIDQENVKGAQVAGIFNIVGDSVKGAQVAGYFNITGKSMKGFQVAGLMNINNGSQKGVQLAALMNLNNKSSSGASIAGLMNITTSVKGIQIAGLGNVNDTLKGVSVANLFNVTEDGNKTTQIAALFNTQKHGSSALQIAALYNITSHLKGVQIGLFNFADSAKGVPIGLFSFVKKGIHQVEINADELFYANMSFRTGVKAFYNVFTIGLQPGSDKKLWQFGYGAGTSFKITNRLSTDITFTMHHLNSGGFHFGTSELYKGYFGVDYKLGKKVSVAAGPTFNLLWTDALLPEHKLFESVAPNKVFKTTDADDFNFTGWIGGRIALRFL